MLPISNLNDTWNVCVFSHYVSKVDTCPAAYILPPANDKGAPSGHVDFLFWPFDCFVGVT
jgi:hypothetical protein